MNQTIVKTEQIVKEGRGVIYGVSNDYPQHGKTCTVYDGENVTICKLQLAIEFPGSFADWEPGMLLDCVFANNLRVVTDGEVRVYWY